MRVGVETAAGNAPHFLLNDIQNINIYAKISHFNKVLAKIKIRQKSKWIFWKRENSQNGLSKESISDRGQFLGKKTPV